MTSQVRPNVIDSMQALCSGTFNTWDNGVMMFINALWHWYNTV